jgi:hypothetical protein
MKVVATNGQVEAAVSFVRATSVFGGVGFCNHCDNFCVLSDGFCLVCKVDFLLCAEGIRRPTVVEAQAALRADVLARLAQESAAGFGV